MIVFRTWQAPVFCTWKLLWLVISKVIDTRSDFNESGVGFCRRLCWRVAAAHRVATSAPQHETEGITR
jgi:hypothetical protein